MTGGSTGFHGCIPDGRIRTIDGPAQAEAGFPACAAILPARTVWKPKATGSPEPHRLRAAQARRIANLIGNPPDPEGAPTILPYTGTQFPIVVTGHPGPDMLNPVPLPGCC